MTSKHHVNKRGVKFFNCGENGHIKRDCRLLGEDSKGTTKKRKKGKLSLMVKGQRTLVVLKTIKLLDYLHTMHT